MKFLKIPIFLYDNSILGDKTIETNMGKRKESGEKPYLSIKFRLKNNFSEYLHEPLGY
jgi:hypothetical protein